MIDLRDFGEYPFLIPLPAAALADIRVGDAVKLVFGAERMWVRVQLRDGDHFEGVLINAPVTTDRIRYGDRVAFELKHVGDVWCRDEPMDMED